MRTCPVVGRDTRVCPVDGGKEDPRATSTSGGCAWAICIAGLSTLVIGARFADMGVGYGEWAVEKLLAMTAQPLTVVSRVLRAECEALRGRR